MSNFGCHLCLCFLAILLIPATIRANDQRKHPKKHVAMFVFGDSLNDPGNNNYLNLGVDYRANYRPYGSTFFKSPTGRFTDGRLLLDFIAIKANLPLLLPYLQPGNRDFINGTNFASSASGIFPETNPGTIHLDQQLSYFKKVANLLRKQLGDREAIKLLSQAVYVCSIGGNDYFSFIGNYPDADRQKLEEYAKLVIGKLKDILTDIYKMGGRKFAFVNIPPIGCMPYMKQLYQLNHDECQEAALEIARLHNNALSKAIKELENQLSGFKYSIFDTYAAIYDMINNPLKHGFKEVILACCGAGRYNAYHCGVEPYELCNSPSDFLFFDKFHPTDHANSQLAELFWNGATNITTPYSLKQLFELDSMIDIFSQDQYDYERDL